VKILFFSLFALGITLSLYFYAPTEVFIPSDCFPQDNVCKIKGDGYSFSFSLDQKKISPITPISYSLTLNNLTAEKVQLLLVGKSMHMDQELITFDKLENDFFTVKRAFPKCEEKAMVWKGVLSIIQDNHTVKTTFNFRVSR